MKFAVSWLCLCLVLKAADAPGLSARDVLNAADYSGGRVSPGEIVVLFPSNAGPAVLAGAGVDPDGRVITSIGETRVLFDGIAAPMIYSVQGKVSAIVPYEVANKRTTQVVVEYQGMQSPPVSLPVVESAPALFTLDASGKGQASMLNETGCCNSARNPAAQGAIAVLYATGEGETTPPSIDGSISAYARIADYPVPKLPVQVTVGGEPAKIVYAGETPHMSKGFLQVNFRVPAKAPVGDAVPIVLMVGNTRSPDGVTMAVRPAVQQILVIDPDPAVRTWLRGVLAGAGYEVYTASNDSQALAQASRHPLDLVVSHLGGRAEDRLETIRGMREQRKQLKLVVTARAPDPGTLKAADLLDAQAVLTKPFTRKVVLQRVRELLRSRPAPYERAEGAPPLPSVPAPR
jgi:uncharacterized protein (TIGR03437 family)